jgi:hypothetical protein
MYLNLLAKEQDATTAVNVANASAEMDYVTFPVRNAEDVQTVAEWLLEPKENGLSHVHREIIGVEVMTVD